MKEFVERHRSSLSALAICVGALLLAKPFLDYLNYIFRILPTSLFPPSNRLDLSLPFLSSWFMLCTYLLKERKNNALFQASVFFAAVLALYYLFSLLLHQNGFHLDSFTFHFDQRNSKRFLLCLDTALALWIITRNLASEINLADRQTLPPKDSKAVYAVLFLVCFVTLALEVTLTRLLSVVTWYHLAFLVISTAMLGMTAGATTVYVKPGWFAREKLEGSLSIACFGLAITVLVSLYALCRDSFEAEVPVIEMPSAALACVAPFYFSGIAVTAALTKSGLPIGKLYASDLTGASLGCLFVLGGLELMDAPTLILLCGSIGALTGLVLASRFRFARLRRTGSWVFFILLSLVLINLVEPARIRPAYVKGRIENPNVVFEKWNSFSRVLVYEMKRDKPFYWGGSPLAPKEHVYQHNMNIDGEAATILHRFHSLADIEHFRFDLTNLAYYLRPSGGACIVGVGGARDVQSAILFGHETIVGIDINPVFIRLLEGRFREFAGVADRNGVTLVVDDARSYLSTTSDTFSVIQMSLIDTWAATGAGAFSLSENSLYTIEAWKIVFSHLNNGIFTVSRWYAPGHLGETGRLVSLAVATLLECGIDQPENHIALATCGPLATLLLFDQPASDSDFAELIRVCSSLQYNLVITPGVPADNESLNEILRANSLSDLNKAVENQPLNCRPPTDETPYFFNMLRLDRLRLANLLQKGEEQVQSSGVEKGNLVATLTLVRLIVTLLFLTILTIVLPLAIGTRLEKNKGESNRLIWSAAAYFSLIGAGFMFTEIALLQRLSVFLGHPVYALGILLFSIIASAGIGSFLSERLPLTLKPWIFIYPIFIAVAILAMRFLLKFVGEHMVSDPLPSRILVAVIEIVPLGMLLGICFPTGMRLVSLVTNADTPWYWALNGIFGLLSSAFAVFISIYFGISVSLYIASACYLLLLLCLPNMYSAGQRIPEAARQAARS
jgi:hypothetical protein